MKLTLKDLTKFTGIKYPTLNSKIKAQKWPLESTKRYGGGRKMQLVDFGFLPDEFQIAWAKASPSLPLIQEALTYPPRIQPYFKTTQHRKRGRPSHVFNDDGSLGICDAARQILVRHLNAATSNPLAAPMPSTVASISPLMAPPQDDAFNGAYANALQGQPEIVQIEGIVLKGDDGPATTTAMGVSRSVLNAIAPGLEIAKLVMLQIRGNSMQPDLHNGDLVLAAKTKHFQMDGGIYLLKIDGVFFIKRLFRQPGTQLLRLVSANSDFAPFVIDLEQVAVEIIGQVIARIEQM